VCSPLSSATSSHAASLNCLDLRIRVGWVRVEFLDRLVQLPCRTTARRARFRSASENHRRWQWLPSRSPFFSVGAPPLRPWSNLRRRSGIGWSLLACTPSGGKFAKEPLSSLDFEPAVQSVFPGLRFRLWKTYFSFVKFKLKFYLITDLPLSLIAHNFFILTPNWPVQLALDLSFWDLHDHIICHHVFEL